MDELELLINKEESKTKEVRKKYLSVIELETSEPKLSNFEKSLSLTIINIKTLFPKSLVILEN